MVAITTMKGTNKSRFTITSNQAFFTTDVFNPIASRLGVQLTSKQIQHMFRLLRCIHHRGVTGSRLATLIQCPYRIVHNHFVLLTTGKKPRLIFFFCTVRPPRNGKPLETSARTGPATLRLAPPGRRDLLARKQKF